MTAACPKCGVQMECSVCWHCLMIERNEARQVARDLLRFCRGREDLFPGAVLYLMEQNPWLRETE